MMNMAQMGQAANALRIQEEQQAERDRIERQKKREESMGMMNPRTAKPYSPVNLQNARTAANIMRSMGDSTSASASAATAAGPGQGFNMAGGAVGANTTAGTGAASSGSGSAAAGAGLGAAATIGSFAYIASRVADRVLEKWF